MEDYIEKEIKFKIDNIETILNKLLKQGAEKIGSAFQRTVRVDTENKSLENEGKFLRVRSGFKNVITLKIKCKNSSTNVFERKEIEIELPETEKMRRILNELGYSNECIMEKYRLNLKLGDIDISLDELPFGLFIELEGEEDKIFDLAQKLDLKEKIIVTYWDLFEDWKQEQNEIDLGKDIVFCENYESKIKCFDT
ncbi:MAG: class IV adenylate cyclase [Candidatus Aenigmarchaeota archaeon]|nr:class IV adenylate cyclase [Candidatus Aenigmarchaeota archaeon]MCK5372784.1 class IV adenylate cyclase [Candidatus Aenigmarchaeota archaeon]MCK5452210.1 class IV adenylate cyclase [Candidatus Aenigmarchaeota archaeon]